MTTLLMSLLAVVALVGALISVITYARTRVIARSLEARAESLYRSSLELERATDRALTSLVNPEPEPTTAELELNEVARQLGRAHAYREGEFAPAIVFSTWDRAQARRAVELARGTGALTHRDVDYLDLTLRLGAEITHDAQIKRKLLPGF